LERIIQTKRAEVAESRRLRPTAALEATIAEIEPPRDFAAAVMGGGGIRLIAEVKQASPSAGLIVPTFDPVAIARTYARCGAAALSVLTDATYFRGDLTHVGLVRAAVPLPVLRKDFLIDSYQVLESRAAGADAVLLIAEALPVAAIVEMAGVARTMQMSVLVEVHSETNLDAVLTALGAPGDGGYLLGINNRDLTAQRTDLATTLKLAAKLPPGTPFVAESGLATRADVETVVRAGARAILVGESLLRAEDLAGKISELLGSQRHHEAG
jgi:indole-3-glycerol phosphate synthase